MRLGVVHQRCERHHDNHHHHHCRRRHRVRCESKSFFGHDAEALTVFAALVASRVVASNDTADGKASVFASAGLGSWTCAGAEGIEVRDIGYSFACLSFVCNDLFSVTL